MAAAALDVEAMGAGAVVCAETVRGATALAIAASMKLLYPCEWVIAVEPVTFITLLAAEDDIDDAVLDDEGRVEGPSPRSSSSGRTI